MEHIHTLFVQQAFPSSCQSVCIPPYPHQVSSALSTNSDCSQVALTPVSFACRLAGTSAPLNTAAAQIDCPTTLLAPRYIFHLRATPKCPGQSLLHSQIQQLLCCKQFSIEHMMHKRFCLVLNLSPNRYSS